MTTSNDSNSTRTAQVIPWTQRGPIRAREVERTLARLLPRIEAGDGAAMLEGLTAARLWWHEYPRTCEALGLDSCDWLTLGWADLHEAIGRAPATGPQALLAKARIAHWQAAEQWGDCDWMEDLHRTILEGVEAQFREAGHV
ncbi:MAG: hypothetical protein K5Q68_03365 [Roseococcus sp.]|nr:hypothetical protein [Roseococcus sp.]